MLKITHIRQPIMVQRGSFTDRTNTLRVTTIHYGIPTKNTVSSNHDGAGTSVRIDVPLNITKQTVFNHHFFTAQINWRIAPSNCVIYKRVSFTTKETWHNVAV